MSKDQELLELIEFEYGDCMCDSEKICRYCKVKNKAKELELLKAENAKLRECVEFYADSLNYSAKIDYKGMHYVSVIGEKFELGEDNGKRARQVLKELEYK